MSIRRRLRSYLLHMLLLVPVLAVPATGAQAALDDFLVKGDQENFLPVREAFRLTLDREEHAFVARWEIADEYYLYRDKFRFVLIDAEGQPLDVLGTPESATGEMKDDEIFGKVEVYYRATRVRLPLRSLPSTHVATLKITYQGCAEAGLCYPPETEEWPVDFRGMSPAPAAAAATGAPPGAATGKPAADDAGGLARFLADASLPVVIGTFLLLGIGLTFTPCVLPMVPILSSIIVGAGQNISTRRAFLLSLAYVLGMALTYALFGAVFGLLGNALQIQLWLQSPPVLAFVALLFAALALSMFGLYELQVPAFLRDRLNAAAGRQSGGHLLSVALMGAISALVVSPCVSAPLAGALIYIGSSGDAVLGGTALFALALGMGVPLLLIGTSGGKILPKAGAWMDDVKKAFGVLLLGVAIVVLARILPGALVLALWAALAIVSAVWLGALESVPAGASGWRWLRRGTGIVLLLYGALLGVGAALGGDDPLQPLAPLRAQATTATGVEHAGFVRVRDADDLRAQLAAASAAGKPAMLDFYAEWCVACRVMNRDVFPRPAVRAALNGYVLLQADVTASTRANLELLREYRVPGLPAMLFFRPDGTEIGDQRILGEQDEAAFLTWLKTRIEPNLQGSGR